MKFHQPHKPTIGSSRYVLKFAWLPKNVGRCGAWVWFERYVSDQVYTHWRVPGPGYKGTREVIGWKEVAAWMWAGEGTSIIVNR